jgi:hypothetical protein
MYHRIPIPAGVRGHVFPLSPALSYEEREHVGLSDGAMEHGCAMTRLVHAGGGGHYARFLGYVHAPQVLRGVLG